MELHPNVKVNVVVDGRQSGNLGQWDQIPLTILSKWDAGSEEEKFEVIAAIRKTYNPRDHDDIRGTQSQSPAQIARCQGFSELRYARDNQPHVVTVIVKPLAAYSRLVPQAVGQH